jgi:hypothetical protein
MKINPTKEVVYRFTANVDIDNARDTKKVTGACQKIKI